MTTATATGRPPTGAAYIFTCAGSPSKTRGPVVWHNRCRPAVSTQANAIRILCVEDHPFFREGLKTIVGQQRDMLMVALASTAEEAIAEFRRHRPDITL